MDNPYHHGDVKPHHLDRDQMRQQCFDAFNILQASPALAGEFEMAEEDQDFSTLLQLHLRLAEPRLSQLLLAIALFVRTFDDVQRDGPDSEAYRKHTEVTDGANFVGVLDSGDLTLREACNKIIHATDFRPLYDNVAREIAGKEANVWYLSGEIEIKGRAFGKPWEATLWVGNFLEIALDRIAFGEAVA